jgi:hypothetical protein
MLANFLYDILRLHGLVEDGRSFIEQTVAEIRERVGADRVICGLSGGVDSSVVAALLYQGHRPAGRLHLRRQRPAAQGRRPNRSSRDVPRPLSRPTCTWSRPRAFLTALAGVTDPQEKRRSSATRSSTCFQGRGGKIPERPLPGPGHALSRRDRKRRRGRRPGRHDQAAPQRRRPAEGTRLRADRAAARPVQGRSPPARPGTGPAGGHRLAASVPRPRAWRCAAWAR